MMRIAFIYFLIWFLPLFAQLSYAEDSVNNAYKVCAWFDASDVLSKPCDVSGWSSAIDVSIDVNGIDARKICALAIPTMKENKVKFDKGWKIRIYSPFSGDNTIAQCAL